MRFCQLHIQAWGIAIFFQDPRGDSNRTKIMEHHEFAISTDRRITQYFFLREYMGSKFYLGSGTPDKERKQDCRLGRSIAFLQTMKFEILLEKKKSKQI